jgi:hypothetical protein
MIDNSVRRRMREIAGLPVGTPTPIVHENCSPAERRRRELAELPSSTTVNVATLTEAEHRMRSLAGITEGALAVKGNSVSASSPDRVPDSESYSRNAGGVGTARFTQQAPSPHPLPSPVQARAGLLHQAVQVCNSAIAMGRPLFGAALRSISATCSAIIDAVLNGEPERRAAENFSSPALQVDDDDATVCETLRTALNMCAEALNDNQMPVEDVKQLAALLGSAAELVTLASDQQEPQMPAGFEAARTKGTLLTENMIFEVSQVSESNGAMRVRGIAQRAEVRNRNNRVYPRHVMEREIGKLQERIKAGDSVFASADHPSDGVARISDAAAIWRNVEMQPDGAVVAEADLLDTHPGKNLQAIFRAGGRVGISARGFGTTHKRQHNGEEADIVDDSYSLKSFDLVLDQSVADATATVAR